MKHKLPKSQRFFRSEILLEARLATFLILTATVQKPSTSLLRLICPLSVTQMHQE